MKSRIKYQFAYVRNLQHVFYSISYLAYGKPMGSSSWTKRTHGSLLSIIWSKCHTASPLFPIHLSCATTSPPDGLHLILQQLALDEVLQRSVLRPRHPVQCHQPVVVELLKAQGHLGRQSASPFSGWSYSTCGGMMACNSTLPPLVIW